MRRSWVKDLFLEALMYALAEGLVAALGWCARKTIRWMKKRRKKQRTL